MPKVPNDPVSSYDRKLIEEIKKRELLWDKSNELYRHSKPTNDAYKEIAENLKVQFDEGIDSESVRLDWKRIRDSYRKGNTKIINNVPSKQPTRKELCLQELCNFLLPFIKSKNKKESSEPLKCIVKHKELLSNTVNLCIGKQQINCVASTFATPKKSTSKGFSPFSSVINISQDEIVKENRFSEEVQIDGVFPNFNNYVGNPSTFDFSDDGHVKPVNEATSVISSFEALMTNSDHDYTMKKKAHDAISPFQTTHHDHTAETGVHAVISPFGTLKTSSVLSGNEKKFHLESLTNPRAKSMEDKNNFSQPHDHSFKRKYEKRSCSDSMSVLKKSISEFKQFHETSTTKVLVNSYVNLLMDGEFKMLSKDLRSQCFDELLNICDSYKKMKVL